MVPTPTPTASPTVVPTPSKFGALPVIANNAVAGGTPAYSIDGTSAISTDPFITTQGVTDSGRIYRGGTTASPATASSVDGLPSNYFLGATGGPSTFDTQVGFDTQFGTMGQVGAFKFSVLALSANPASISTAGGPTNLAFVSVGAITDFGNSQSSGTTASTFDLRGLDNVLFVTQQGSIMLSNGLTFTNSGTTATSLTLYARGGPLGVFGSNAFNLPGSALNLYSDSNVNFDGSVGSMTAAGAGAVNLISGNGINVDGLLHASGSIAATTVSGGSDILFNTDSQVITDTGDFNANSGAGIFAYGTITTGGDTRLVAANGVSVVGNITTGGNLRLKADGGDITTDANSALMVGGIFTASATAGSLTLNGAVGVGDITGGFTDANPANLTAGGDVLLNGSLAAAGDVTIASTGGNVTLSGNATVFMNGGVFSANANQALDIEGTVGTEFGEGGGRRGSPHLDAVGRPGWPRPNDEPPPGLYLPVYATGVAGNGLTVNGAIFSSGTGGDNGTDGITLTATGGNLTTGSDSLLQAGGGGVTLAANSGTMSLGGSVQADGDANLTSSGDLTITGFVYAGNGTAQVMSNGGALNLSGPNSYVEATGDVNLFGSAGVNIDGAVYADTGGVNLTSYGNVTVGGYVSAGSAFSGTSYGGTLTVNGEIDALGGPGTVSSLSASSLYNGALAVNGTVNVGRGEIDFNAGTTFANDPTNSSITATTVNITAGTTATVQLSRFHYGGDEDPAVMNVTAQTIVASTDPDGEQGITPLNLTATGPITLTGDISVETLKGGNLTISPDSTVSIQSLNTTGATGAFVVGDGSYFHLNGGGGNNATGAITLDGSPTVQLSDSLAVAGGISVTSSDQTPQLNLDGNATLTATGSIALGAGNLNGNGGSTVATNSTLTTTGDVTVSTLHAHGGFTVGTLSAGTITLQDINGQFPASPPSSVVDGAVSAYRFDSSEINTFTLGQFTAGALLFAGMSDLAQNPDGFSLTLNITGNFGIGAGGVAGFVTSGDFSGGAVPANSTNYNGATGGPGGTFLVTTTPPPVGTSGTSAVGPTSGTPGNITIQDNGTGIAPVVNANGGAFAPTINGVTGTGGAGGTISLHSSGLISLGNGATLTAAGGNYAIAGGQTTYTAGGATNGGAGGTVTLDAGTTLTLTGGTGSTAATGPISISVPGGRVLDSTSGTGGRGGTVNLSAAGAVSLLQTQVNAAGGNNTNATTVGDAPGGTINVTSSGASSTVTTVALTNATLNAANGLMSTTQADGTGGTINILSEDATAGPAPNPTPVPAIQVSASDLVVSQERTTSTPAQYGSLNGGTISLTSRRTGGLGISVQAGSQLLAMVDYASTGTGGTVSLTTGGADVSVVGGSALRASGFDGGVTLSTGATGGTIDVDNSTLSTADSSGATAAGSTVSLTAASAINVGDSSTVAATAVTLNATGASGAVTVGGSTTGADATGVQAGTITLEATGSGAGTVTVAGGARTDALSLAASGRFNVLDSGATGVITLGGAGLGTVALNADVLKIQASGANGSVVINAGSTLSATTQLLLYATGGSGSITFKGGNITLNTGSLAGILAAPTITIQTGTIVTVNGQSPLQVYTNTANYSSDYGGNNTQTGTFAGTAQPSAAPQPFAAAPAVPAAVKGGAPPAAARTGSRVVAAGPGFLLVATRVAPRGPALPAGARQGPTAAGLIPPDRSAAGSRKRGIPVTPTVNRPGAGMAAR